jgi:WD40 repeat protein
VNRLCAYSLSLFLMASILLCLPERTQVATSQEVQPDPGGDIAWSPDGTELAVFARNGVFIFDRDFRLRRYRDLPSAFGRWSPDSTKLIADQRILSADTLETLLEPVMPFHTWLDFVSEVIDFGDTGREIRIWDVTTGTVVQTIASPAQIECAVPSTDSRYILVVVANGIFVFEVSRALVGTYILPVRSIRHYTWNSEGTRIAYSADADVPAGTPGSISSPTVGNPDASSLYTVSIMDASTGLILRTSDPLPESILSITWSRNAPRLAGISNTGAVYIWDADTLKLLTAFSVPGQVTLRMDYSPYGGVVAIGTNPNANTPPSSINSRQPLELAEHISSLANDTIQLVVPEASLERLEAIQAACVRWNEGFVGPTIPQAEAGLDRYIAQVEATPAERFPPGCAADLIAVARAIQSQ